MNLSSILPTASAPPSVQRDDDARAQARQLVANLQVLLEETEDILAQAEGFTSVATWLPGLSSAEFHLARTVGALSASAGLVVG